MTKNKRMPLRLILTLFVAIALDTSVQFVWKSAVIAAPEFSYSVAFVKELLDKPAVIGVFALMTIQFLNWLFLLAQSDLSYAQPVTALSYVTVYALSIAELNERIDWLQCLGLAMVLAGVWFISRTGHLTQAVGEPL